MYCYKSNTGVYYSRICTPKNLISLGYPFDFKVSLLTKDQRVASLRNVQLVAAIKALLLRTPPQPYEHFRNEFENVVQQLREGIHPEIQLLSPSKADAFRPIVTRATSVKHVSWLNALEMFLQSKQDLGVTPLTVRQLDQRIQAFFEQTKFLLPQRSD